MRGLGSGDVTRWIEVEAPRLSCSSGATAERGSAARILTGWSEPPASLAGDGRALARRAEAPPGRVVSGGVFRDPAAFGVLADRLPEPIRPHLGASFEWYLCRGAFFHNDAHFAGVLFGAWCVAGPPRDLVFPRARVRIAAVPGHWMVFDPFEPHGVLDAGELRYERSRYEQAGPTVFAGFEIELTPCTRSAFGIAAAPAGAPELSSATPINAETGAVG